MSRDTQPLSLCQASRVPARRAGSIRRTSSIEIAWPDGRDGSAIMTGNARDALTHESGVAPEILAQDSLSARVGPGKVIESLTTDPPLAGIEQLAGASAIMGYRRRLSALPDMAAIAERPLALLLDDLVGCNIISGWIWTKWITDRAELERWSGDAAEMENACVSYATGSNALSDKSYLDRLDYVPALQLEDDPHAFHALAPDAAQTMRRVRLIDVSRVGSVIEIAALFQDSGVAPGIRRAAVHEYALRATADARDGALLSLEATPGTLPHGECVAAPAGLTRLIGVPLGALRETVLRELRGPAGCTHLNDAVRALSAAATLARMIAA